MTRLRDYQVVAHNTATASTNRIHDDDVAQRYGFSGGLVPGVDVYAYMTHPPAEGWGLDWLARGSLSARFLTPVYDGDQVTVTPGPVTADNDGQSVTLEVRNEAGTLCATGEARLPTESPAELRAGLDATAAGPGTTNPPATNPAEPGATAPRPPASPSSLAVGTVLTVVPHTFHADRAGEYLADVREALPLYTEEGVAHPGWLLRDANYLLSTNVVLGPWIHVESAVQHHGVVRDGEAVDARGVVTREWEHKGHRFVELELGILAGPRRLVASVRHTAIYQPRQTAG